MHVSRVTSSSTFSTMNTSGEVDVGTYRVLLIVVEKSENMLQSKGLIYFCEAPEDEYKGTTSLLGKD